MIHSFDRERQRAAGKIGHLQERDLYATTIKLRKKNKHEIISKRIEKQFKVQTLTEVQLFRQSENLHLVDQMNLLELEMLKTQPDYSLLISSGVIKFLADHLKTCENPDEFIAILRDLTLFSAGPSLCASYLEKLLLIQTVIKKMHLICSAEDAGLLINFYTNLLTTFDNFFLFLKSEGILKLKKTIQSFGFGPEIIANLKLLCFNLSIFSDELGDFDSRILASWIEVLAKTAENEGIVVEILGQVVKSPASFELNDGLIEFIFRGIKECGDDSERFRSLMKIVGYSSVNRFYCFTEQDFMKIFNQVRPLLANSKVKKTFFWLVGTLIRTESICALILNTNIYLEFAKELCTSKSKVRLAVAGFFYKLFKSNYCSSGQLVLIQDFFEYLFSSFELLDYPEEVFAWLKLLKSILLTSEAGKSLECYYRDQYPEFILELISRYLDHPNKYISDEVLSINELLYC